jgi:hypothetical protein
MTELLYDDDDYTIEVGGFLYRLGVHAEAEYSYTPGSMYRRNPLS